VGAALTELGASASAFLKELALRLAPRRNGGQQPGERRLLASVQRYAQVKVGRAVMKQLAWQVCTAFAASPCAALSQATRFRHTSLRRDEHAATCTCGAAAIVGSLSACCCNAAALQQRA
jgi:hypothetical protein